LFSKGGCAAKEGDDESSHSKVEGDDESSHSKVEGDDESSHSKARSISST
jgi:hypothetical protein